MNTESRQSRTPRHGRAATLTLAGAIVGSLLLPTGLAAAASAVPSSAAVQAGVGVFSGEKPPLCGKHCGRRGWGGGGCWRPWCGPWGWGGGWGGRRHHRDNDEEIIRIRTPRPHIHRPIHHEEPVVHRPPVKQEPVKPPVKDEDKFEDREDKDETPHDDGSWWPNGDDWRDIFGPEN
ncbi:hypothetical protein ACIBO5_15670 [Nonomuraea angiospora]|uniref:hypothetical protein n=1 Tax=Nonomuraea angiospora TaxID=46172 RepID=UPI0029BC5791|nr:hypothetical protein [Nonomuraea angiospora]MDX3100742.1 hypothetical protein [Nonomuraea angiospora]